LNYARRRLNLAQDSTAFGRLQQGTGHQTERYAT